MKKITALLALMATFTLFMPVSTVASSAANVTLSPPGCNGMTTMILHWAAEEFNSTCGTDYCFSQLKKSHRRGELTIEKLDETTYRVSFDGNDLIGTLEDFL